MNNSQINALYHRLKERITIAENNSREHMHHGNTLNAAVCHERIDAFELAIWELFNVIGTNEKDWVAGYEKLKALERGCYEYECVVCGRRTTSSTINAGTSYDGGEHCGQPVKQVRWVPIAPGFGGT